MDCTEDLRTPWAGCHPRAFAGMLFLPMTTWLPRAPFRFLGKGDSPGEACPVPTLHARTHTHTHTHTLSHPRPILLLLLVLPLM